MDISVIKDFSYLLICPKCKSEELRIEETTVICERCKNIYNIIDGIPIMVTGDTNSVVNLTTGKWDEFYKSNYRQYGDIDAQLYSQDIKDVLKYIDLLWSDKKNAMYMEIGCGPALIGLHMFKKGHSVIGIDTSYEALKIAQDIYRRKNARGFFVCADIDNIPLKDGSIDLLYGGGVIEHVKKLDSVVAELYRVMKASGKAFNTVPYMSLGALTYRQFWGNIPDFPLLKQLAEFIHIKLLQGKHMKFGYEKSFPIYKLKHIFDSAGFNKVNVDYFDCNLKFEFVRNVKLKELFKKMAKHQLFWPMVYINSSK